MQTPSDTKLKRSNRILGGSLAWVALRCTLQYIVLPFMLPFLGVSGTISMILSAILSLFALGMMAFNVWQLWGTSWRWRYLGLSVVMGSIVVLFLYLDLRALLSTG
jgi:hypothetical protein